jgi:hypothetical protein
MRFISHPMRYECKVGAQHAQLMKIHACTFC